MIVKAILSAKGGDVISIDPTATLDTAVKTLAEHKIGALLVLGPDRRVIGILSERDIVRALAERGAGVLSEPLAQVMTRKVVTCSESDSVGVLMEKGQPSRTAYSAARYRAAHQLLEHGRIFTR